MFRPVRDAFCCAAVLLAVAVGPAPATAQAPAAPRIFAAQTGPDQVTLAWESVPGATEYRIYLGNPEVAGAPALTSRPLYRLGGSSRRVLVNGVRRLAGGAYLLALAGGQVLFRGTFNAVTPAPLAPVTPPAAVQAVESGPTEVTVSWTPVIGATAYMISRAVGGWGLSKLCDFCPPTPRLVDRNATPGLAHLYTVQAIFPLGISTRTASNRLTVGGAQLATASTGTLTGPISTMMTAGGTGTWDGGVGASAGGSSTGTTGTTTSTTTPTGGATTAAALMPPQRVTADALRAAAGTAYVSWGASPSSGVTGYILYRSINGGTFAPVRQGDTSMLSVTDTAFGGVPFGAAPVMAAYYVVTTGQGGTTSGPSVTTAPVQIQPDYRVVLLPPKQVNADGLRAAAGTAYVSWGPSPSSGVTGYILYRTINGGPFAPVRQGGAALLSVTDTAFGAAPFAAGPVIAAYYVVVTGEGGATSGPSVTTAPVQIQAPYGPKVPTGGTTGGATGSTPAPAPPSCKLDYQRADNMWAAFGQPSGALGTESIALANGQTKTFVTDWAFEKKRNDGTTYYGSHLRVATNPGAGVILLHVRNPLSALIAGIAPDVQSTATGWLTIKPGVRAEFRDDLVEVHCGP